MTISLQRWMYDIHKPICFVIYSKILFFIQITISYSFTILAKISISIFLEKTGFNYVCVVFNWNMTNNKITFICPRNTWKSLCYRNHVWSVCYLKRIVSCVKVRRFYHIFVSVIQIVQCTLWGFCHIVLLKCFIEHSTIRVNFICIDRLFKMELLIRFICTNHARVQQSLMRFVDNKWQ